MISKGTFYFIYPWSCPEKQDMYYISKHILYEDVGKGTVLGSVRIEKGCSRNRAKEIVLEEVKSRMTGLDLFTVEVPVFISWDGDFMWKDRTFIGRV